VSGQDFARLISSGWVPVGMVLGIAALARHDDFGTRMQAGSWSNQEVAGYTELVTTARHLIRERLHDDCARQGGEVVVLRSLTLQVREEECSLGGEGQRDHVADAFAVGTAVVPFRHTGGNAPPSPFPILRVNRNRP
jgi:hypothetical protein